MSVETNKSSNCIVGMIRSSLRKTEYAYYCEVGSDFDWLKRHEMEVKGLGLILQFLRLAIRDDASGLGWKLGPRSLRTIRRGKQRKEYLDAPPQTGDDLVMFYMLSGIASNVEARVRRESMMSFMLDVFDTWGFVQLGNDNGYKPTPLLRELFFRAAENICKINSSAHEVAIASPVQG